MPGLPSLTNSQTVSVSSLSVSVTSSTSLPKSQVSHSLSLSLQVCHEEKVILRVTTIIRQRFRRLLVGSGWLLLCRRQLKLEPTRDGTGNERREKSVREKERERERV